MNRYIVNKTVAQGVTHVVLHVSEEWTLHKAVCRLLVSLLIRLQQLLYRTRLLALHKPIISAKQRSKGKFLYSAVSSPQDRSKRFTLYIPADLFNQIPSQLVWEVSSHTLQLIRDGCSYTYPPLSIASYSIIQPSELEQCRVKNLPKVLTPQHRI